VPENTLRAQPRAIEKQTEQPGREKETKYRSDISEEFKKYSR